MKTAFDPAKDIAKFTKHGISLALASGMEWETALTWLDTRAEYGEDRECGIGYVGLTLFFVAFVDRSQSRRIISLRRAPAKR